MVNDDVIPCGEEEADDRTLRHKLIPDEEYNSSHNQEGNDRMLPQTLIPDEESLISADQEGDDRIPPYELPDDDVIPSENQEDVERISQNCKSPYNAMCMFEETGEILLLKKRICKVSSSVDLMSNKMHAVGCVFETYVGQNRIREDLLEAE